MSVTDSTDLDNDDLTDVAKERGLLGHAPQPDVAMGTTEDSDFELAQQLQVIVSERPSWPGTGNWLNNCK